jgi:nitrate reductase gamma subunit
MMMVMVVAAGVASCFFLASLIYRRALRNTIIVAFPDDVGISRERE